MAWSFRAASFRGVEFFLDSASRTGGRSLIAHEIPSGAGEIWEDTGPEQDKFSLEAYIVAPTSMSGQSITTQLGTGFQTRDSRNDFIYTRRDALLAAIDKPGPGVLIHPTWGTIYARARVWNIADAAAEQFYIRVTIEFVRDREELPTVAAPARSSEGEAESRSQSLETASGDNVTANLATSSVAETARNATSNELTKLSQKLRKINHFASIGQEAATLSRDAVQLARDAKDLATAPADLVSRVVTSIRDVERAAADALGAFAAYESLLEIVPSVWSTDQENANATIINSLTRAGAVGGALRAAVNIAWDSYEQAIAARDRMLAKIEALALVASDDEYQALTAAAASFVLLVPSDDEALPRIGTFTPPTTMAAIVIAWRLYADPNRDVEIIDRNEIKNPNFVLGGQPLQVLVDAER